MAIKWLGFFFSQLTRNLMFIDKNYEMYNKLWAYLAGNDTTNNELSHEARSIQDKIKTNASKVLNYKHILSWTLQ